MGDCGEACEQGKSVSRGKEGDMDGNRSECDRATHQKYLVIRSGVKMQANATVRFDADAPPKKLKSTVHTVEPVNISESISHSSSEQSQCRPWNATRPLLSL